MSKPFEATLKDPAGIDPGRFLAGVDAPPTLPVRLLTVDLPTVTAAPAPFSRRASAWLFIRAGARGV